MPRTDKGKHVNADTRGRSQPYTYTTKSGQSSAQHPHAYPGPGPAAPSRQHQGHHSQPGVTSSAHSPPLPQFLASQYQHDTQNQHQPPQGQGYGYVEGHGPVPEHHLYSRGYALTQEVGPLDITYDPNLRLASHARSSSGLSRQQPVSGSASVHGSVTADQQTSNQYEHGYRPTLARGQPRGYHHAQPAMGYPAHVNANPSSAAHDHQQPDQHQGQHHQQLGQRQQQRKRTPETGADHATYGDPQATTFPRQFTEWNTQPLYVDPKMLQNVESDLASTSLYSSYAGSSSHDPNQYQPATVSYQPSASVPPPHHPVAFGPGVAASAHGLAPVKAKHTKSRAIAKEEIDKKRDPPFSEEHIRLVRGYAEAADFKGVTAYYAPPGGENRDLHCLEPGCPVSYEYHRDEDCKTGVFGNGLEQHYQERHRDCFFFRCYVTACPQYGKPFHGWNVKNNFVEHIKRLLDKLSVEGPVLVDSHLDQQHDVDDFRASRELAEIHIKANKNQFKPNKSLFTDTFIMQIRAFAEAADFEHQTAYWGHEVHAHHHCFYTDTCEAAEHKEESCETGFTIPRIVEHFKTEHRGKYVFRCYVVTCRMYGHKRHGFKNASDMYKHVGRELDKEKDKKNKQLTNAGRAPHLGSAVT